MRVMSFVLVVALVGILAGCGGADRRAARAQEEAARQQAESYALEAEFKQKRLDLLEKYKNCVVESEKDNVEDCDSYLKVLEAMQ